MEGNVKIEAEALVGVLPVKVVWMMREKYLERRNLRQMTWNYLVEVDGSKTLR